MSMSQKKTEFGKHFACTLKFANTKNCNELSYLFFTLHLFAIPFAFDHTHIAELFVVLEKKVDRFAKKEREKHNFTLHARCVFKLPEFFIF